MSRRLFGSLRRRNSRRHSHQSGWPLRPVSAFESLEDRLLLSASCVVPCAATACQSSKCAPLSAARLTVARQRARPSAAPVAATRPNANCRPSRRASRPSASATHATTRAAMNALLPAPASVTRAATSRSRVATTTRVAMGAAPRVIPALAKARDLHETSRLTRWPGRGQRKPRRTRSNSSSVRTAGPARAAGLACPDRRRQFVQPPRKRGIRVAVGLLSLSPS